MLSSNSLDCLRPCAHWNVILQEHYHLVCSLNYPVPVTFPLLHPVIGGSRVYTLSFLLSLIACTACSSFTIGYPHNLIIHRHLSIRALFLSLSRLRPLRRMGILMLMHGNTQTKSKHNLFGISSAAKPSAPPPGICHSQACDDHCDPPFNHEIIVTPIGKDHASHGGLSSSWNPN